MMKEVSTSTNDNRKAYYNMHKGGNRSHRDLNEESMLVL